MKKRTKIILDTLEEMYPDARCELNYETPFQLLVATILSAQTTDKKVNNTTIPETGDNITMLISIFAISTLVVFATLKVNKDRKVRKY